MQFLRPAQELQHLLHIIASQPHFARKIKEAASLNQTDTVKRLIRSTGVTTLADAKFTPDGLLVIFQPEDKQACFAIRLSLCW
jgi:ABC-type protease/lipase transport system fused ATPase/permease subunit